MKPILCHLAQLHSGTIPPPTGWAAKHLESCQHCRTSMEKMKSLESRLRSETPPCDEALCDSIMAQIKLQAPLRPRTATATHRFTWNPWLLGGTGFAAAFSLIIAITTATSPSKKIQSATPIVTVIPPAPLPSPIAENHSLAQMMHQQELMQRDARKLGAHLREHVILFQPGN